MISTQVREKCPEVKIICRRDSVGAGKRHLYWYERNNEDYR
jgi:hypothetical protein